LLRELHTTAEEVHKAVEAAIVQRPYDEAAVRDRVRAELEANPILSRSRSPRFRPAGRASFFGDFTDQKQVRALDRERAQNARSPSLP